MNLNKSTKERAVDMNGTQDDVERKKATDEKKVAKTIKADVAQQIALLLEQMKNMGETEKNQAAVEANVKDTIAKMSQRMQAGLLKASQDREKAI